MLGLARLGDPVFVPVCAHGWLALPATGVFTSGSPTVFVNDRPAVRVGDGGIQTPCGGPSVFTAVTGDPTFLINDLPAVKGGDTTLHCGISPGKVLPGFTALTVP